MAEHLITFVDTEIDPKTRKILDIGSVMDNGNSFHKTSVTEFIQFLIGTKYICGHNILNHDVKYIGNAITEASINPKNIIDTLYLSPLLFPTKPYHALLKDDKLQTDDMNNPLNDSIKAKDLFYDEVAHFTVTTQFYFSQLFHAFSYDTFHVSFFLYFVKPISPCF